MKRILLIALLLLASGCQTFQKPPSVEVDYAQLYNNAVVALSVAEQGLATWELLATLQGKLTDEEIKTKSALWQMRIDTLRIQVEALNRQLNPK